MHIQSALAQRHPVHVVRGARQPAEESANPLDRMGAAMSFARNSEIYGEDEPADCFYKVVSGLVCTSRILANGRRQIGAFYFPGDVFGLEAGELHSFAAEAIANSKVLMIKRSAATAAATYDAGIAREMWRLTSQELQRAQAHIMLLIKGAQERVAAFLLEMAGRIRSSNEFDLPMSRRDIADYLGLTMETVSRIFTGLEGTAMIALPSSRHVVLRDRHALQALNS